MSHLDSPPHSAISLPKRTLRNLGLGHMPRISLVWLIGALAALALSGLRIFPAVALATLLSNDRALTPVYEKHLQCSQWTLAILALGLFE